MCFYFQSQFQIPHLQSKKYILLSAHREENIDTESNFISLFTAINELAKKYDIQLPIIEQVNAVLFEDKSAEQAVKDLMLRDKKLEVSDIPWEQA